jgi:hypothetical protein
MSEAVVDAVVITVRPFETFSRASTVKFDILTVDVGGVRYTCEAPPSKYGVGSKVKVTFPTGRSSVQLAEG